MVNVDMMPCFKINCLTLGLTLTWHSYLKDLSKHLPKWTKEVGALPSSTWPKQKVTFILVPVLWYPPASPQLPSLEFLQVSRFVCYVFWAEVPLCVPGSGFLFAICSSSYSTDTASGMFLCREWPLWECHCGSKGTCSCAHDAALYHQGLAQHHL